MDKLNEQFARVRSWLRSGRSGGVDPRSMWNGIVVLMFASLLAIAAGAVLSYQWALSGSDVTETTRDRSKFITASELDAVISYYRDKEARYSALRETPPRAPSLDRISPDVQGTTIEEASTSSVSSLR